MFMLSSYNNTVEVFVVDDKSLISKIFDFIGYNFMAIIVGMPLIPTIIVIICAIFGIEVSDDWFTIILFVSFLIVISFASFTYAENKIAEKVNQEKRNSSYTISTLKNTLGNIEKNKNAEIEQIKQYANELNAHNSSLKNDFQKTFCKMSEFISDANTFEYELFAQYLDTKSRPAHKKAKDVRELKQKTKEYIKEYKLMRYEYDMLFSLFPELENYIEYYSAEKDDTIEDVKENYDYVRSWVSKEEYERLGEDERNQLALDRYISSRTKSKWAIGRDYEMYIGHEYEQKGYIVTYTGITDRLEDKGRDLIAQKGDEVLIIQCKNWSKYKEIHENHICQLFGTTIQYNIENPTLFKARPVFITSATLSETAMKFAQYLNVEVIQNKKFEEFPRIKCNIGNNEKIYHLPFDQQYDRTIIGDQKGEFFAWTVEEAVNNGFRRAKKYFYAKQ